MAEQVAFRQPVSMPTWGVEDIKKFPLPAMRQTETVGLLPEERPLEAFPLKGSSHQKVDEIEIDNILFYLFPISRYTGVQMTSDFFIIS